MLISELAKELGIDPAQVSKLRTYYREESGRPTQSQLEGEELQTIRAAQQVKIAGKGITYRQAIQKALGLTTDPLTADQVSKLESQVADLEMQVQELRQTVAHQNAVLLDIALGVQRLLTHLRPSEAASDDQVLGVQSEAEQAASQSAVTGSETIEQQSDDQGPEAQPESKQMTGLLSMIGLAEVEQQSDDQVLGAQSETEQMTSLLLMTGPEEAEAAADEGVGLGQTDSGEETAPSMWPRLESFRNR